MFTYQRDAAQVAQFANQYNFDELVACLTDYLDPKAAAKHLKLDWNKKYSQLFPMRIVA